MREDNCTELNPQRDRENDLANCEMRFRTLFANMPTGMAVCELVRDASGIPVDYRFLEINPSFERHTGLAAELMAGRLASEVHAAYPPILLDTYVKVVETLEPVEFDFYFPLFDRHLHLCTYATQKDHFATIVEDITARKKTEETMRIMAKVFSDSNEAILITDAHNAIIAVNAAFERLTGYVADDVIGKDPKVLSAGKTTMETYRRMWQSIKEHGNWQGELIDRRKDGGVFPKWLSISTVRDMNGQVVNYIGSFIDISERKASEERVRHLAHHDALTNLPNRFSLHERLAQALGFAQRHHNGLALMLIDLDNFKAINDSLGHQAGDQLLIQVAARLSQAVRASDIVARLGGDEFVVVLPDIDTPTDAAHVAEKILDAVTQPYSVGGQELRTSPSIGICLYPDDADSSEDLMRKSDVAMYHAKSQGRANFQFFTEELQSATIERIAIENDLRTSLEAGHFALHYQPQLDLRTGRISGVEALLRWHHPERGLVPPSVFIPIAEETGIIIALGDWVLREACRQLSLWQAEGIEGLRMSVNLSAIQFFDPQIAQRIAGILAEYALEASMLDLEVTESMSMRSPEDTVALMEALTVRGMSLSIDDFGTGYSSLAYLKLFPISTLKIDRSFVCDIETDKNGSQICDITVLLAHRLGLEVVAEGVETPGQMNHLRSIGCERLQGYLISRPLPADQVVPFIRKHQPLG